MCVCVFLKRWGVHSHTVRRIDFICEALDLALLGCRGESVASDCNPALSELQFSQL